jgi:DNA-binding NtrC family response regulator
MRDFSKVIKPRSWSILLRGGNRRNASEELRISWRTLQYRLQEFGIIDEAEGNEL